MLHPEDPLLTFHLEHPDFNSADDQAETLLMVERNRMIRRLLRGEVTPDECADLMSDQGGVDAWIEATVAGIDEIIANDLGSQLDPGEVVLYLPPHVAERYLRDLHQEAPQVGSALILPPSLGG